MTPLLAAAASADDPPVIVPDENLVLDGIPSLPASPADFQFYATVAFIKQYLLN